MTEAGGSRSHQRQSSGPRGGGPVSVVQHPRWGQQNPFEPEGPANYNTIQRTVAPHARLLSKLHLSILNQENRLHKLQEDLAQGNTPAFLAFHTKRIITLSQQVYEPGTSGIEQLLLKLHVDYATKKLGAMKELYEEERGSILQEYQLTLNRLPGKGNGLTPAALEHALTMQIETLCFQYKTKQNRDEKGKAEKAERKAMRDEQMSEPATRKELQQVVSKLGFQKAKRPKTKPRTQARRRPEPGRSPRRKTTGNKRVQGAETTGRPSKPTFANGAGSSGPNTRKRTFFQRGSSRRQTRQRS